MLIKKRDKQPPFVTHTHCFLYIIDEDTKKEQHVYVKKEGYKIWFKEAKWNRMRIINAEENDDELMTLTQSIELWQKKEREKEINIDRRKNSTTKNESHVKNFWKEEKNECKLCQIKVLSKGRKGIQEKAMQETSTY